MAVNGLNFGAQVDAWVQETKQRMDAVLRQSTQEVVSLAQANVPVDTGFLRASIRGSLKSMPPINKAAKPIDGKSYGYSGSEISLTIAGAEIGDVVYIGWTAGYAGHVEYGTNKMAPRAFVRTAAAQWTAVVNRVSSRLKDRATGSAQTP